MLVTLLIGQLYSQTLVQSTRDTVVLLIPLVRHYDCEVPMKPNYYIQPLVNVRLIASSRPSSSMSQPFSANEKSSRSKQATSIKSDCAQFRPRIHLDDQRYPRCGGAGTGRRRARPYPGHLVPVSPLVSPNRVLFNLGHNPQREADAEQLINAWAWHTSLSVSISRISHLYDPSRRLSGRALRLSTR